MITGVIGLTLWTDDLEKMFHFYNDTMRLPLHARHDDFIAFEFGGFREFRFNLGLHDEVQGMSRDPYRVMANFGVDDIDQEYQRLLKEGVEFIRPPGAGALGRLGGHPEGPRRQHSSVVTVGVNVS